MASVFHPQQDEILGAPINEEQKQSGWCEKSLSAFADAHNENPISNGHPSKQIVHRRYDSVTSTEETTQFLSLAQQCRTSITSVSSLQRSLIIEHRPSIVEIIPPAPAAVQPNKINIIVTEKPIPVRHLDGQPITPDSEEDHPVYCPLEVLEAKKATTSEQEDDTRIYSPHAEPQSHEELEAIAFASTQLPLKVRKVDTDGSIAKRGRRKILSNKYAMHFGQVGFNGFLIFCTWWWTRYYYVTLPLITATVAINCIMIVAIILRKTWNTIFPEKKIMPEKPESMVWLIPCYNETKEEMLNSLDSLVAQKKIEQHEHAILIICDGKVRGPGMEKTTGDYLLQDILTHRTERKHIKGAYTAWDQQPMDVVIQKGTYGDIPYLCIVKQQNQGKRDSLIVVRSFLYNFNRRAEEPRTIYSPRFFNEMCKWMTEDAKIDNCDHLIGMDADTVFDPDCIYHLLEESRYPKTVGVCGYVAVDWKESNWNLWRLYQSCEYTIAQSLRRLHQSMVTHKVSCLPGCCQLLKICEETCGDFVLIDLFGYCPVADDNLLKQIRATASEDRNHVCHMLMARPQSQTRQALRANAYTDVPRSWSVFLSQRRRWTLGATSNDLLLMFGPGVQWFERIVAAVNVTTWLLNPFIIASLACFIYSFLHVAAWLIMCFVSVMLIPIVYCFFVPIWLTRDVKKCVQFWLGFGMYVVLGPFLNISVLIYASIYMDSFGWGKTRKVISDDASQSGTQTELERLEQGDKRQSLAEKSEPKASEEISSPSAEAKVNAKDAPRTELDEKYAMAQV